MVLSWSFKWLPFAMLYALSGVLAFLLRNVIKYRKAIILKHLSHAFPDKSTAALEKWLPAVYHNLAMVILEGIKGLGTPVESLYPRYKYLNPEIIARHPSPQAIILASHQNNWEWGALTLPHAIGKEVLGVYKPLSNPIADAWLTRERGQHGVHLVPMALTRKRVTTAIEKNREFALVLIADQTPSNMSTAHFTRFLNQPDTPFSPGPDLIARSTGLPVFYAQVRRIRPGYYTIQFELLENQPKELEAGDITRKYVAALEKDILSDPPNWLWSHARWKHKRPSPVAGLTVLRED